MCRRTYFSVLGPKVINRFSCSTQLRLKFKIAIDIKITQINGNFGSKSPEPAIYPAHKC